MGMQAWLEAKCDGCGVEHKAHVVLDRKTADGDMGKTEDGVHHWADDIWSWVYPEGWLQVAYDEITHGEYLFFHDNTCYVNWLLGQGRQKEVEEFQNAVWIG